MGPDLLVPIAFFATVFGLVYVVISARNKERLALIDKGLDVSTLRNKTSTHGRYDALKFGILLIGLAIGLLLGNMLESYTRIQEEVAYFSMILLFGGIALLIYYAIIKKLKPE
jgi:uncharacterized membrane protein